MTSPDSSPPPPPTPPPTPPPPPPPPPPPSQQRRPGRAPKPATPQPKPQHGTVPEDSESAVGSGSATGFVSMLARRQFDPDALAATPGDEAARRDRVQMAREVFPPAAWPITPPATPAAPAAPEVPAAPAAPAAPAVPGWYKVALPVALLLAVLLLAIGIWAIGALVYMHNVAPLAPQDVHYPLISWRLNIGNLGGYTPASRFMAWAMLLCLPVAGLLVVMAMLLRQRGR